MLPLQQDEENDDDDQEEKQLVISKPSSPQPQPHIDDNVFDTLLTKAKEVQSTKPQFLAQLNADRETQTPTTPNSVASIQSPFPSEGAKSPASEVSEASVGAASRASSGSNNSNNSKALSDKLQHTHFSPKNTSVPPAHSAHAAHSAQQELKRKLIEYCKINHQCVVLKRSFMEQENVRLKLQQELGKMCAQQDVSSVDLSTLSSSELQEIGGPGFLHVKVNKRLADGSMKLIKSVKDDVNKRVALYGLAQEYKVENPESTFRRWFIEFHNDPRIHNKTEIAVTQKQTHSSSATKKMKFTPDDNPLYTKNA